VALPLLLAGPILRRVEPTLVCVWVALSESATLKLTLWEGRVNAGSANAHVESAPEHQDLRRIGEHLFVGVVRLKLDAASPKKLQPGRSYSYDLTITPSGSAKLGSKPSSKPSASTRLPSRTPVASKPRLASVCAVLPLGVMVRSYE
jgi:hypothetical protein